MARDPRSTIFTVAVILMGIWVGVRVVQSYADQRMSGDLPGQLPDLDLVNLQPADLPAHGFQIRPDDPKTWRDISLRLAGAADGVILKVLRCRIAANELVVRNADLLIDPIRQRPSDDQPPSWWPDPLAGAEHLGLPEWFAPEGEQAAAVFRVRPLASGRWVAEYLHYDRHSEWLHFWEWQGPAVLPRRQVALTVGNLAQALADHLIAVGHPADADGWLHAPGRHASALGIPADALPEGLEAVDALLLPRRGQHRFLLAIHGMGPEAARELLDDVPPWTAVADAPPPHTLWEHALPRIDGERRLPSWFRAGAGPRWVGSLARLEDGRVERGRWAAYDAAARCLVVWDWDEASEPLPPSVDPVRGIAQP